MRQILNMFRSTRQKNGQNLFLQILSKTPESTNPMTKLGLDLTFKIRKKENPSAVNFEDFSRFYMKSTKRLFLIDYDEKFSFGYFQSKKIRKKGNKSLRSICFHMEVLTRDSRNIIFVLSGRTRDLLHCTFRMVKFIGIFAENGFYFCCQRDKNWDYVNQSIDLSWVPITLETMRSYTERTDGSFVEEKNTGLVWHFADSDPNLVFGKLKKCLITLKGS
jgi:trehalose-6-phosphatase